MTDEVVNPGPGLGQAQKGGGVKSVNGTPLPPTLDLNSDDNKINNNLTFECTYLKISTIQELPGGFAPLVPLPGLCPGPTEGLQWPPDPLPKLFGTSYILESTSSLKKIVKPLTYELEEGIWKYNRMRVYHTINCDV